MAPFSEAIKLESTASSAGSDGKVFQGVIDPEWTVVKIPHGGYILSLLVEAAIQFQSATEHKDPIHVTAHYLRASAVEAFEIHIRVLKKGKEFTNLIAELFQKDVLRVTTHMIFGHNGPSPGEGAGLTLLPPSPYARRVPLHLHPSTALDPRKPARASHRQSFNKRIEWTKEPDIEASNAPNHPSRTNSSSVGGEGVHHGGWLSFIDKDEQITRSCIPLLVDVSPSWPLLLPRSERQGLTRSWFPTITLSLEFKAPIPPPSEHHASRTVGVYLDGKFINHPKGRHETCVEVWTAPTNIGEGKPVDGWRDKQVCIAVATQMGLTISRDEVERKFYRRQKNVKL